MNAEEPTFGGLEVAAFESRRHREMGSLIERHGGVPHVSPSMREVPLEVGPETLDFAHRLITGEVGIIVFLTGVGVRMLIEALERHVPRQRFLDALSDSTTVARGPKPVAALREHGIEPSWSVPAPNTWREVLTTIDQHVPVASQTVALQEYGESNPSLLAGLEARGARVLRLNVYRWDLPEDRGELEENVRAVADGRRQVLLFTSANQVQNVLETAGSLGLEGPFRDALRDAVVASIGPTTSERLRREGLPVDLEASQGRMGHLVRDAARRSAELRDRKQHIQTVLSGPASDVLDTRAPWYDSPFMRACRREPTEYTPVWLMRQAGRYMAEYRAVRERVGFLELCRNPQLCSEVMCTAVERLGVDAAIIFSDLLPILEPMGLDLEFAAGHGPVIHNPVREPEDVDRVLELESVDALHYVVEAVRQTRADLPADMPLIGFAGAPFTLASYTIEGGGSRHYLHTKTLMYRDPGAWQALMARLARAVTLYLKAQISAGAQCVQIFDSWVGCLGPEDYRRYVHPYMQQIVSELPSGVPMIHFATGNPSLLPFLARSGSSVVGIDWRIRLDEAWATVGYDRAVQGNLDPATLLATPEVIRRRTAELLDQVAGRPGHIFNLGHGVLPQTPVEHAVALVEAVHELSRR